jgi:hypothetical protein
MREYAHTTALLTEIKDSFKRLEEKCNGIIFSNQDVNKDKLQKDILEEVILEATELLSKGSKILKEETSYEHYNEFYDYIFNVYAYMTFHYFNAIHKTNLEVWTSGI